MCKITYCGMDCTNCPIYKYTINKEDNKIQKELFLPDNNNIKEYYCLGCNSNQISTICFDCFIRKCNIFKEINNCSECDNFPCDYLLNNISEETLKNLKNK